MNYTVSFGSGWKRDAIGLAGKGQILITDDSINLSGRQHTAIFFKILLWLLSSMMMANILVILCSRLFSFSAGVTHDIKAIVAGVVGLILTVTVATFLTKYFGSSPYSFKIPKDSIVGLRRVGTLIKFKTASQEKYHMFRASSEQEAERIELEIKTGG